MLRFILLFALLPTLALADRVTPSDRVENFVTVRDTELNGVEISRLLTGQFADLISTQGSSYFVELENGSVGYVSRNWTSVVADTAFTAAPTGQLTIHFIDVGQGDSTLIVCPDNSSILIDAGSTSGTDQLQVLDYITEALGPENTTIDTLFLTHADQAHFNLIPDLLNNFSIGNTYHVGYEQHYNYSPFNDWLNRLPGDSVTRLDQNYFNSPGSPHPDINCGEADIYILAADIRSEESWRDTRSIVLKIQYDNFSAILSGDATFDTENIIMNRYSREFLNVDLLKIANHGSVATSSSDEWINTVQPLIAVVSANANNKQGHPRSEVIDRIAPYTLSQEDFGHALTTATGIRFNHIWETNPDYKELIYSTADNGNVMVISSGQDADVSTNFHGK